MSLGTFALFSLVGNTGGEIRHAEIRANGAIGISSFNQGEPNEVDRDGDDD